MSNKKKAILPARPLPSLEDTYRRIKQQVQAERERLGADPHTFLAYSAWPPQIAASIKKIQDGELILLDLENSLNLKQLNQGK